MAAQCKENIYCITTLKDFQFVDRSVLLFIDLVINLDALSRAYFHRLQTLLRLESTTTIVIGHSCYSFRDGKDQGANVRERAKQLVSLLQDEDRLRSEREKSLKNKVLFESLIFKLTIIGAIFESDNWNRFPLLATDRLLEHSNARFRHDFFIDFRN